MLTKKHAYILACLCIIFLSGTHAQNVRFGGSVGAKITAYTEDFDSYEDMKLAELGNIFFGNLNLRASVAAASAIINVKIEPSFVDFSPISMFTFDEAYARVYFGDFTFEGGLRKLTWGKADSFGPLDVINPLNYSDMSEMSDTQSIKLPRPLIRLSYNFASFTKLEAVFVPWFQSHAFALSGRWAPAQITGLSENIEAGFTDYISGLTWLSPPPTPADVLNVLQQIQSMSVSDYVLAPTTSLQYAQAGLRFTTSIASADIGAQYYFGRLPRPAVSLDGIEDLSSAASISDALNKLQTVVQYNYYHQIGIDYAQVLFNFNVRAEFAANITKDVAGTDGGVYNPHLVWSFGFDRDIFGVLDFYLQCNQTIRLLHDKISTNAAFDTEAETGVTSTRITFLLSRKFFRDELEIKLTGIWGIEDSDCYLIPAVVWSHEDVELSLSSGIFMGDPSGELGQYRAACYIKASIVYTF
jgi:hypothetical protein